MASSKIMASSTSRDSDINLKGASCASTPVDFLRIDSGEGATATGNLESDSVAADGILRNACGEGSSGSDRGQRPAFEPESKSGTLLNAEITLLDAAGAVSSIGDGEVEPPTTVRKTVDDVWREIVAGKKREQKPKEEMMTLEDFLAKVGAAEDAPSSSTRGIVDVKEERFSGGFSAYESSSGGIGAGQGVGQDLGGFGGERGKRSMSLLEPLNKAALQRQRRMIKNRESAARSRERKQAYLVELETMVARLEEENDQLLKEKAVWRKERLRQLMDNVIPVVEKQKHMPPSRLRRLFSTLW